MAQINPAETAANYDPRSVATGNPRPVSCFVLSFRRIAAKRSRLSPHDSSSLRHISLKLLKGCHPRPVIFYGP